MAILSLRRAAQREPLGIYSRRKVMPKPNGGVDAAVLCCILAHVGRAQLTIYPMYADMSAYGPQAFHGFGWGYLSRLPIIILPAGVMCLAWALLLWLPCRNVPKRIVWTIVAFCIAFVAVTPIPASAQHQMSVEGFSNALQARLLWSNGIRAIIFTVIGLLALNAARRRWMISEPPGA
jgi:hypothetical protein